MPYYTTFCEPDLIAMNDEVEVYQAYKDEEFDQPLQFWFIPTPPDVDTNNVEEEYDTVDIRELGYIEGSAQTTFDWIKSNLDKMKEAITPFEEHFSANL